jgi:hypothetical protein
LWEHVHFLPTNDLAKLTQQQAIDGNLLYPNRSGHAGRQQLLAIIHDDESGTAAIFAMQNHNASQAFASTNQYRGT